MTTEISKQLLDWAVKNRIDLQRYGNGVVRDVISLLNTSDKEMMAKIAARGEKGPWTSARLKSLFVELGQMNYDAHVEAGKMLAQEMYGFADHEADSTQQMLQAQVPVSINTRRPSPAQLAELVDKTPIACGPDKKLLLEEIFTGLAKSKEESIRGAIRLGVVEGETTEQIVRRLVGTRAARFTDGLIEKNRRGAEAMVRTIVNHVSNGAVQKTYAQNGNIVKGWTFLATLDNQTTITCASLSGTEWPVGQGPIPPLHVNCRSFALPILKSFRELGVDIEEMPASTRSSKDGQVRSDISFNDWLHGQPAKVQKDILGATRQKLFIEGKLPLERFTDSKGVVYTLDELKKKNEGTFKDVFGAQNSDPLRVGKSLAENLKAAEDDIRNLPYEKARVFDSDGNLILKKTGEKSHVAFTPDEMASFKDAILTHNHPSGSSFSSADLVFARHTDMLEIRAVSTKYDYSIKRDSASGWAGKSPLSAESLYAKAREQIKTEYNALNAEGKLTQLQINDFHHAIIERFAKLAGLDYSRTEVN